MKNIRLCLAATVSVTLLASSAQALPAGYKKFVSYQDGIAHHDIVLIGQTPSTVVSILDRDDWLDRKVIADACGMAKHPPTTKYPVNQIVTSASGLTSSIPTQDLASLPVQTIPTCNKTTGVLSEPRTADFKTADGTIVKIDGPLGLTTVYYEKRVKAKATAAGTVRIKNTPLSNFRIGTANYADTDLTTTNALPVARKSGAGYALYVLAPN